jgi:hypothetical protein
MSNPEYDRGLIDGYRQAMTDTMQACEQIISIAGTLGAESPMSKVYLQAIRTIKEGCEAAVGILNEPPKPAAQA